MVNDHQAKNGGCTYCKYPLNWSLPRGIYIPNYIPISHRIASLLVAVFLIALCTYAVLHKSITIPYLTKTKVLIAHFAGASLLLPMFALLCGLVAALSVIIDHYDKRKNESIYKMVYFWSFLLGWGSYFIAIYFAEKVSYFLDK
ncbi:hypothetical protein [Chitinimonas sp. BJB300]|uniref:hypothetical protein n=1 Tax=Chitinimonas sp. BJB300 TaxID=1559339 RepID=UPI00130457B6|nr:hypothetical protein [Chitinimonas sp. BJB300]